MELVPDISWAVPPKVEASVPEMVVVPRTVVVGSPGVVELVPWCPSSQ
jgi:hypothetical protein